MKKRPHKGFIPKFYLDQEKNLIRGKVLNTRDTITFHGRTVAEAWNAFRDSVDDYLRFCAELGVEPEKPFNGKVLVRISPAMHRNLNLRAQEQGLSINTFVKRQLEKALESDPLRPGIMDSFEPIKSRPVAGLSNPRTAKARTRPKAKVKSGTK